MEKLRGLLIRHYVSSLKAKKKGTRLAWVSIPSPVEIFYAMDIAPLCPLGIVG